MPTNQLHPLYHCHSFHVGSRVDLETLLPADLDDADLDEFIDEISEPPKFVERISPVSTVIGTEIVRGKNWTEMMQKSYRVFLRLYSSVSYYIRQALAEKFDERAMIPFTTMDVDPDTLHRMVELDYEQGENTYGTFMEMFRTGVMSPCATVPFHVILPLLDNDFDRRLCIRMGLLFHWKLVETYHEFLESAHGEEQFILPFWFPEGGISDGVIKILHEEFLAFTKAAKIKKPHLLLLLDNVQAIDQDNDILMKSWNQLEMPNGDLVSLVFRDRGFSEWVTYSNPSVKKLIDRTIAKVDSELNSEGVDYCWSHFEDLEALTFTSKSGMNFEQKVVKLTQLSYLSASPDFFIRRKMTGKFHKAKHEPQTVKLRGNTSLSDWHNNNSFGRWVGFLDSNAMFKLVDESRPYLRRTKLGKAQEVGPQCWKIALVQARETCTKVLKGNPDTMTDGFLGVLAGLCGSKDAKITARNVAAFLTHYTYIHWREHFIQHDMSEADTHLAELVNEYLLKDVKKRLKNEDYVIAGVAAQGYYLALDSHRSHATYWENMDQRAVYQNVAMLTLAFRNLIYIHHWQGKAAEAKKLIELFRTELLEFHKGFDRYKLADYGVTRQEWDDALKSQVEESPLNVVERAARRTAARHLRPLGYRKDFTTEDQNLTSNTGHIWSAEVENSNYKWENKLFCGIREE
ncbi:MAG: hypothetical protein K1X53_01285 [Candidatus Sumerlaeaceae bacterium]|nr:hypothetical protein [Candidatus Sumerlaeaceae bacterium]